MALIKILFEPFKAFEHIKEKDDWWIPYLLFSVILIIAQIVSFPIVMKIMSETMGNDVQPPQGNFSLFRIVRLISIPVVTIITFLSLSVLVYLFTFLFGKNLPFIKGLDLISYISMVNSLKTIIGTILVIIRRNVISSFADMRLKSGLDLFFRSDNRRLNLLISEIDIFNLWFYILLALGISYITGLDKKKSAIISFIVFIFSLGIKFLTAGRGRWF